MARVAAVGYPAEAGADDGIGTYKIRAAGGSTQAEVVRERVPRRLIIRRRLPVKPQIAACLGLYQ